MKKDKDDDKNQENDIPSANTLKQCGINITINGCTVSLNPRSNPPTAEGLFHAMFFEEELPKAPNHYRQQRWNKRRIQKRWNWKKGRDREIYERRAEFLKNQWIEMKKDFVANESKKLSKEFLDKHKNVKINLGEDRIEIDNNNISCCDGNKSKSNSPKSVHESDEAAICFSVLSNIDLNKSHHHKFNAHKSSKNTRNEAKKLSKLEGKRKHVRRREKLIERIANGETLEDFVDHQKLNNINNNNETEKDNLLFGGNNKNNKKSKSKAKKSKKRHKNNMKLADFVQAAEQLSNGSRKSTSKEVRRRHRNDAYDAYDTQHNTVSLDDIQAEQIKDFEALARKKRDEVHGAHNESQLFAHKVKGAKRSKSNPSPHIAAATIMNVNPLLHKSMKITNYDHMVFRSKIINEIYCGSSVFSCIPCCVEPSNTLLVEAAFVEKLLMPHSSNTLFELKKRLKKQLKCASERMAFEILPIFEKAYIDKECVELFLIQFQDTQMGYDNIQCALSLHHCWKQQTIAKNDNIRIEFVEKWFGKAYFLQHSHLWSDISLTSNLTVYDNNDEYIRDINKKARHCHCSFKRVLYFPPFKSQTSQHDISCINSCCCCTFYHDDDEDNDQVVNISNGDTVLWNGRKCMASSKVIHSNQEYKIQIDPYSAKYIVALSSLQLIKKYNNMQTNQIVHVKSINQIQNDSTFDAHKHIVDDLSFVLYVRKFWNISN